MRMKSLLLGDIQFQYKYGFYFLYLILSIIYIGVLLALPTQWREKVAILMIFSDPAAMGLFFMGAIVLFEKSENVLDSIAVSPVKPLEYVVSKLCSIAIISTLVGLAIDLCSGSTLNILYLVMGVFLGSSLFSSVGLIIAAKVSTLNSFIIATLFVGMLISVPALAYLFGFRHSWFFLHPGVSMIQLIWGHNTLPAMIILLLWTLLFTTISTRAVSKMFQCVGGIKL